MNKLFLCFVVFCGIVLQVAYGEDIPEKCKSSPPFVEKPHECCKIPPLFKEEDLQACGFEKFHDKPKGPKPTGPPPCDKHVCILKKYNLMADDEIVNKEALITYLEGWVKENKAFAPTLSVIKDKCIMNDLVGPNEVCEPIKSVMCVATTMFTECPEWTDTTDCAALKTHVQDCKQYFHMMKH